MYINQNYQYTCLIRNTSYNIKIETTVPEYVKIIRNICEN